MIGPNGAGKTSLFNCMSGVYRPTTGHIRFAGADLTKVAPYKIPRLGLARTFQAPALFRGLTVIENIMAGRYLRGRGGVLAGMLRLPHVVADEVVQRRRAEEVLSLLEISHLRHESVDDLAYGLQKRVEFGRALAQEPKLLLLDEPMAGMTVDEKEDMSAFILTARDQLDVTLVLVEHDMEVVMDIAERVVVLNFGRKIADATPGRGPARPGRHPGLPRRQPGVREGARVSLPVRAARAGAGHAVRGRAAAQGARDLGGDDLGAARRARRAAGARASPARACRPATPSRWSVTTRRTGSRSTSRCRRSARAASRPGRRSPPTRSATTCAGRAWSS